jgi:hypothetical protein
MERPMIRQSMLFGVLAICLAMVSMSMTPRPIPLAASSQITAPMGKLHALTGVAFHSTAIGY